MIVVDSSALLAIIQGEVRAPECRAAIAAVHKLWIAAPTLTETLIVAMGRNLEQEMQALIANVAPAVLPLTETRALAAADAYRRWGKGRHPASLNFGDCFAYAAAIEQRCPLLYVGTDFAQTGVESAIATASPGTA